MIKNIRICIKNLYKKARYCRDSCFALKTKKNTKLICKNAVHTLQNVYKNFKTAEKIAGGDILLLKYLEKKKNESFSKCYKQ